MSAGGRVDGVNPAAVAVPPAVFAVDDLVPVGGVIPPFAYGKKVTRSETEEGGGDTSGDGDCMVHGCA